ncbi:MAG: class I SAM-dependent methyltransferase [Gemmatimonadales bacterium]|nr:MAG: class I SAM-dependent methyltransferase [Gemmatimonadales bacterium]
MGGFGPSRGGPFLPCLGHLAGVHGGPAPGSRGSPGTRACEPQARLPGTSSRGDDAGLAGGRLGDLCSRSVSPPLTASRRGGRVRGAGHAVCRLRIRSGGAQGAGAVGAEEHRRGEPAHPCGRLVVSGGPGRVRDRRGLGHGRVRGGGMVESAGARPNPPRRQRRPDPERGPGAEDRGRTPGPHRPRRRRDRARRHACRGRAGSVMGGALRDREAAGSVHRGWDRWAPVYRHLERLALGLELERCRAMAAEALSEDLRVGGRGSPGAEATGEPPFHCLVLGDGDGRGLERIVRRHPGIRCTSVDVSQAMISRARLRLGEAPGVRWVHGDIRDVGEDGRFDAVMTQFFLDCFTTRELAEWWGTVAGQVAPGGSWIVADFTPPSSLRGWRGLRQRVLVGALYRAFGWTTPMEARALPDIEGIFRSAGWRLEFARDSPSRITGVRCWRAP